MEDLITIIVPIFNSEKYLQRCLDSIKKQTYTKLEILLLDDESLDNSIEICKSYLSDSRFKLIKRKHCGVSSNRNYGIDISNGKYIMFVDSDDYILNDNYILNLYTQMNKDDTELIISGMTILKYDKIKRCESYSQENKIFEFKQIENEFIQNNYFNGCYRCLILKERIGDIRFDENLRYAEDLLFMYKSIKAVNKFSFYANCDYCYVEINGSSLNNGDVERQIKYLKDTEYVLNIISSDSVKLKEKADNRMKEKFCYSAIRLCKNLSYKDFKKAYYRLSQNYNLKSYDFKQSKETILTKTRLYLLKKNNYFLFYCLNRLIKMREHF